MKKIQFFVFIFSLAYSFTSHALMQINCQQRNSFVQLNALSDGSFSLNFEGTTLPVQLDLFSSKAEHDLFSYSPITVVQDHYNSTLVFSVPHGALSEQPGESFKGELQYRDYDEDYDTDYRHLDQGPLKNGYALDGNSVLDLNCETVGN